MYNNTFDTTVASVEAENVGMFSAHEVSGSSAREMRKLLHSRLSLFVNRSVKSFFYSSARSFGMFFLALGIMTLLMNLLEYYFLAEPNVPLSSLVMGAVFALISIPLIIFDKPLVLLLQSFSITDFIFFEFFAISRAGEDEEYAPIHPLFGLLFGIIFAVLGYFTSLSAVMLVLLSVLFLIIALICPEFPFVFNLIIFPFINLMPYSKGLLAVLTLVSVISFFRKVIVGKRVFFVEIYDIVILLFTLLSSVTLLVNGGRSAAPDCLYLIAMALSYIPASNIVVNRRLADCAMNAIIVSSVPVSIFCIVKYVLGILRESPEPQGFAMGSPEGLCAFLIVVVIFSVFLARERKRVVKKLLYTVASILGILAVLSTECLLAAIPLIVVIISANVIKAGRLPKELLLVVILLPALIFLLPDAALEAVSEVLRLRVSLPALRDGMLSSFHAFTENLFFGIQAPSVSTVGIIFSIGLRYGILALMCLILLLIIRLSHLTAYTPYIRSSTVRPYVRMVSLGFVALISFGIFVDLFAGVESFFFFFSVYGLCSATLRISKKETDDRLSYYGDSRSSESSVIEVSVRK